MSYTSEVWFSIAVAGGGLWVSDPDLPLLYTALPLAILSTGLGCTVQPDITQVQAGLKSLS